MIQKYEGFLSNLFKKKPVEPVKEPSISNEKLVELSNDSFIELVDDGYTVKNRYMDGPLIRLPVSPYVQITNGPYVQITKHSFYRSGSLGNCIPYKFIDVKADVLAFHSRLKDYDIDIEYSFVYENDKGGFSCDYPKYEDFEKGDYDNREVSILTIYIKD